jgi:hypothetical protein
MEPVELSGELVAIEPLSAEHAAGLLAAADAEEVFAWLPYPRPADLQGAWAWIADALADRDADRRLLFAVLDAMDRSVVGSTSYWDMIHRPGAYDPPVDVRRMRPDELDSAVSVWREANVARSWSFMSSTSPVRADISVSPSGPRRTTRPPAGSTSAPG